MLWDSYERAETRGVRSETLDALTRFIRAVTSRPLSEWEDWAADIAYRVIDRDEDIPIRTPLFRAIVFPALLRGHQDGRPNYARWLAGFAQTLYKSPDCLSMLPPNERTEVALLRAAVSRDPNDEKSINQLLVLRASYLRYTLHELPAGVLYGHDSATVDQCLELESELQEFVTLAKNCNQYDNYKPLVQECRLHYRSYRRYLEHLNHFSTYQEYLRSEGNVDHRCGFSD